MHPRPQPSTGAEAFARMLDGTGEVRSWPLPDLDDLPELVELTRAIAAVPAPQMRPEFSADLRARLLEADPVAPREPERPIAETAAEIIDLAAARKRKATRRAYVAVAVGSIVLSSAGIAAAAQNALPGSPLYGVKRAIESAELSFATNDIARGVDLLDQAQTRLDEVKRLSESNPPNAALIQQALQSFTSSASEGTNLLFTNYQRNGSARDLARIQQFASTATQQLNSFSPAMISQNRAQMLEASSLVANVEQQSKMLCPTCATLPPLTEQYQQMATAAGSSNFSSLLAAPRVSTTPPSLNASAPAQSSVPKPSAPTAPTRTPTAPKTPVTPPTTPVTPPTNVLGQTVGSVLQPVTGLVGGVAQTTTGTVGGLLGVLLPAPKN